MGRTSISCADTVKAAFDSEKRPDETNDECLQRLIGSAQDSSTGTSDEVLEEDTEGANDSEAFEQVLSELQELNEKIEGDLVERERQDTTTKEEDEDGDVSRDDEGITMNMVREAVRAEIQGELNDLMY